MSGWNQEICADLKGKEEAYEAEIWAHDFNAAKFKKRELIFKAVIVGLAAALMFIGSVETYIDPLVFVWLNAVLKALNFAATSFYGWYNPGDQRMQHIMASATKGAVHERIKQQLLMPEERREDAADFDRWIGERMGSIGGSTPYLPASLLAQYPKKKSE